MSIVIDAIPQTEGLVGEDHQGAEKVLDGVLSRESEGQSTQSQPSQQSANRFITEGLSDAHQGKQNHRHSETLTDDWHKHIVKLAFGLFGLAMQPRTWNFHQIISEKSDGDSQQDFQGREYDGLGQLTWFSQFDPANTQPDAAPDSQQRQGLPTDKRKTDRVDWASPPRDIEESQDLKKRAKTQTAKTERRKREFAAVIPRNQIAIKKLGETLFKFGSNHKVIRSSGSLVPSDKLALPLMQTRQNFKRRGNAKANLFLGKWFFS